jgi:4-amino-4-deoxy-L-arabinose transferase-like glycosyltransferase
MTRTMGFTAYRFSADHRRVGFLFLAALALRIGFVLLYDVTEPPTSWGDDIAYDRIATTLVEEQRYVNSWFPPGYPLFLASIYATIGRHLALVRLLQAFLGSLTCVIVYLLGRQIFSRRVGLLAGGLLAIFPGHIYMSWRIMGEVLFVFLWAISIFLALRLLRNPRPTTGALLGLTMGSATLVKSNLFVLPPLIILWLFVVFGGTRKKRLRCVTVVTVAFLGIVVATPITNAISGGSAVPLPGNAGRTLWWANNPLADGYFIEAEAYPEGKTFIRRHDFEARLAAADDFERDKLYGQLALIWIRENPTDFFRLCGKKLNGAFGLFPQAVVLKQNTFARRLYALSYGLIASFALPGLLFAWRKGNSVLPLYGLLVSYLVMVLLYYGTPRFTITVIPALVLFAAYTMVSIWDLSILLLRGEVRAGNSSPLALPEKEARLSRSKYRARAI